MSDRPLVDTSIFPLPDPTANVINNMAESAKRQDDLRELDTKRQDDLRELNAEHRKETDYLRMLYDSVKDKAETKRIDDNRSTDILAVAAANAVSVQQANTLAAQVATSADAQRSSLANALEPIQKDISEIRKTQYEAAGGKQQQTEAKISTGQIIAIIGVFGALGFGFVSTVGTIIGIVIYFKG